MNNQIIRRPNVLTRRQRIGSTQALPGGTGNVRSCSVWQIPHICIHDFRKRPRTGLTSKKAGGEESMCNNNHLANEQQGFSGYELARDSGALAFWDDPQEFDYTSGQRTQ